MPNNEYRMPVLVKLAVMELWNAGVNGSMTLKWILEKQVTTMWNELSQDNVIWRASGSTVRNIVTGWHKYRPFM